MGGEASVQRRLEEAVMRLLAERGAGKTICPSEAARAVSADDWQSLMAPVREAAERLVAAEKIVVTQGGRVVDGKTAKGPVRLRLR